MPMPVLSQSGLAESDRFDTELVVLVDKEFAANDTFDTVIADRNSGRTCMTDDLPLRLLSGHSKLSPRRRVGMRYAEISRLNCEVAEIRAQLARLIDRPILEALLESPVKMAFLIDSEGGDIEVQNSCLRAAEYVNQRSGEVTSLVTGSAQSAAFSVMAIAENIHVLTNSALLWHFSSTNEGVERARTVNELREGVRLSKRNSRELEELFVLLRRSPFFSNELRDQFLGMIKNPNNKEGQVTFTGQNLTNLLIADFCYDDVRRMAKWFDNQYVAMDNAFIMDFWVLSDLITRNIPAGESWHDISFERAREDLIVGMDNNIVKRRRLRKRFLKRMHNET